MRQRATACAISEMVKIPRVRVAVLLPGILGSSLYYDHSGQRHYIWREDFATNYQTLISNPAVLRWTGRAAKGDLIEKLLTQPWVLSPSW